MPSNTQEISKNTSQHVYADFWEGTVVSVDPGTNIVIVAPDGENNVNQVSCLALSSTISAALGFNETVLPTVGTRVRCGGRGGGAVMFGAIPYIESQGDPSSAVLPNKAILGAKEALHDNVHSLGYLSHLTKSAVTNSNLPTDVTQGEKVIGNEFGVMLGLFKLLATLKASELAQVQCHFLDDLVRIVSHNFQHYTGLGELKVFHDGKGMHLEMGATHSPSESMGVGSTTNDSGIIETTPDKDTEFSQFYKMSDDQLTMLERMKLFVGKLGDFVNFMIVNPSEEQHALNGKPLTTPDTGLLQIKAGLDGSLVVRSVNGIYLEKTNWIRVPQRIRTPEDPQGDDGSKLDYQIKEAYQFEEKYTYRNIAFLYYLQLRDYLAYINEEVGYKNFKTHVKDFNINDLRSKELSLDSITYVDSETGVKYKRTKSWVSLMNNGGISLADAWGSAISMEGGNIYIQPAKDLIVQPNRNLIAKVGGSVSIAVKKEIDLSSTEGGMRVKTHNAQHLYSKEGGIILQTDAPLFTDSFVKYPDTDMVTRTAGIIMKAPKGIIASHGYQVYQNATESLLSKGKQVTLDSSQLTRVRSSNDLLIGGTSIQIVSKANTTCYSDGFLSLIGMNSTLVGKANQTFGLAKFMGSGIPVTGLLDPANNNDKSFFEKLQNFSDESNKFQSASVISAFKEDKLFTDLKFQFPPTKLYSLDNSDIIPQTLSQQNEIIVGSNNLQNWVESSINSSYPYPGNDNVNSYVTIKSLNTETDQYLANKAVDLVSKSEVEVLNVFEKYKSM
jgi:hypothetical protein